MQKINQIVCLIILLVFVTTSCMARARAFQGMDEFDLLNYLFKKRDCLAPGASCTPSSQCCTGTCRDFYDDAHLNPPCASSDVCFAGLPPPCCVCYNS